MLFTVISEIKNNYLSFTKYLKLQIHICLFNRITNKFLKLSHYNAPIKVMLIKHSFTNSYVTSWSELSLVEENLSVGRARGYT